MSIYNKVRRPGKNDGRKARAVGGNDVAITGEQDFFDGFCSGGLGFIGLGIFG